jgi:hypothetical protein
VGTKQILVVANQTLGGTSLRSEIQRRLADDTCKLTLVVPATPPQEHATWTEGEAIDIARHRLDAAIKTFSEMGADVEGVVGDASPITAIDDALRVKNYDEIIVSTLPPGLSRWLKQDLPHRVERRYELPVTMIIGAKEPTPTT